MLVETNLLTKLNDKLLRPKRGNNNIIKKKSREREACSAICITYNCKVLNHANIHFLLCKEIFSLKLQIVPRVLINYKIITFPQDSQ